MPLARVRLHLLLHPAPRGEGELRISSDGSKDFFGFESFAKIATFQEFSLNL